MSLCSCGDINCPLSDLSEGLGGLLPMLLGLAAASSMKLDVSLVDADGKYTNFTGERRQEEVLVTSLHASVDEALQVARRAKLDRDEQRRELVNLEREGRVCESSLALVRRHRHLAMWELNSSLVQEHGGSDILAIRDDHGRYFIYRGEERLGEPLNAAACASVLELDNQIQNLEMEASQITLKVENVKGLIAAYDKKARLHYGEMDAALAQHHPELFAEIQGGTATLTVKDGVGTITRTINTKSKAVMEQSPEWRENFVSYAAGITGRPREMRLIASCGQLPGGPAVMISGDFSKVIALADLPASLVATISANQGTYRRVAKLSILMERLGNELKLAKQRAKGAEVNHEIAHRLNSADVTHLYDEMARCQHDVGRLSDEIRLANQEIGRLMPILDEVRLNLTLQVDQDPVLSEFEDFELDFSAEGEIIGLIVITAVDKTVPLKDDPKLIQLLHAEIGDHGMRELGLELSPAALSESAEN